MAEVAPSGLKRRAGPLKRGDVGFARDEGALKRHAADLNRRERTRTRVDGVPSRRTRPLNFRDRTRDEAEGGRPIATASQDVAQDR